MSKLKLNPVAFGSSLGIVWGVSVLFMALFTNMFLSGKPIGAAIGQMYVAYTPSVMNSFLAGGAGLISAFIAGYLIAWLYNAFLEWPFFKTPS
jgi:hypothetical protein